MVTVTFQSGVERTERVRKVLDGESRCPGPSPSSAAAPRSLNLCGLLPAPIHELEEAGEGRTGCSRSPFMLRSELENGYAAGSENPKYRTGIPDGAPGH